MHPFKGIQTKKRWLLLLTVAMAVIMIGVFVVFNQTVKDTARVKTKGSFTSTEFLEKLATENGEKLEPYIEQAIEVEGIINEINILNGKKSIFITDKRIKGTILCELQKKQSTDVSALKVGEKIKIKGIYKGYLLDAILLNCIVLETALK